MVCVCVCTLWLLTFVRYVGVWAASDLAATYDISLAFNCPPSCNEGTCNGVYCECDLCFDGAECLGTNESQCGVNAECSIDSARSLPFVASVHLSIVIDIYV